MPFTRRLLGFNRAPIVAGRVVDLETEILPVAHEQLSETFFRNGLTFKHNIHVHIAQPESELDASFRQRLVLLRQVFVLQVEGGRRVCWGLSNGRRSCVVASGRSWLQNNAQPLAACVRLELRSKSKVHDLLETFNCPSKFYHSSCCLLSHPFTFYCRWEIDDHFCDSVKLHPPYDEGPQLVDLIDATVLDYLIGTRFRHNYPHVLVHEHRRLLVKYLYQEMVTDITTKCSHPTLTRWSFCSTVPRGTHSSSSSEFC